MAGSLIGPAVGAGLSLLGGGAQSGAAGQAGFISEQLMRESIAEQRRQYDQSRQDFAPYRETGANALSQYAALYGISRGGPSADGANEPEFLNEQYQTGGGTSTYSTFEDTTGEGDWSQAERTRYVPQYSSRQVPNPAYSPPGDGLLSRDEMQAARDRFMETPGYQFRMDEGLRALDRSANARGGLRSGGHDRALVRYSQGVASDEFNNYANRLAGIAGMGQGATQSTATLGANSANSISNTLMAGAGLQSNALMAAGTARASGFAGAANAINGGIQNQMLMQILSGGIP